MKPRPILLMAWGLDLGGSERQMTEIAKALDPVRYQVHIGCSQSQGMREAELRARGIPIAEFPMSSFVSLDALRQGVRLAKYINRNKIQLVHTFNVPMDIFAAPAAKLSFAPVVLTSQRAHRSLTQGARLKVLRWTDKLADGIVVNCEYIRRHLIEDERVDSGKIHLCYNGLNLKAFQPRERVNQGPLTIGCVCALRPEKNLPLLVRAFADAKRSYSDCRLVIVGSGPMQSEIERTVAECCVTGAVTLIPKTREVPKWLHTIDIFVLPSRTEALSNALIEAMACGCAVMASDVGGNPELVGANERGLLFRSDDRDALSSKLVQLIEATELRRSFGIAARRFVEEHFTIEASAARMTEIYELSLEKG